MSSILTNTSSMVALQTLKSINMSLQTTQSQISTGKAIGTAKDNSAIWAISKVMESDVAGFKAISDSLNLGDSTIGVARQGTETVTTLLKDIKAKVVAAQGQNVDRAKIQTDIVALRDQITSVVNAAQFNGLNMLKGTDDVKILSSLDRASDGTVTASSITIARQDLTTSAGVYGTGTSLSANATASAAAVTNAANSKTLTLAADTDVSGNSFEISVGGSSFTIASGTLTGNQDVAATAISNQINALGLSGVTASATGAVITIGSTRAFSSVALGATKDGAATGVTLSGTSIGERAENITFSGSAAVNSGDSYQAVVGGTAYSYIAGKGENFASVAAGLKAAVDGANISGITTKVTTNSSGQAVLKIDNNSTTSQSLTAAGAAGGTASGGLFGLGGIDVSTSAGAAAALGNIETMINQGINSAASFGSAQGRIQNQSSFISKMTDSLKAGIGTLVDANMEEASARLQALQVQQQLGVRALSIANKAPQSILSLFR